MAPTTSKGTFKPYKGQTIESPLAHLLLKPFLPVLQPLLRGMYAVRFTLARPMNIHILPKCITPLLPIGDIKYITYGEILLMTPLVIMFMSGYNYTFNSPSVDSSGEVAGYAIVWTFLTANKANSVFSFLFGIPFERMITHHLVSSLVAVVLGGFHTYVAYQYGDDSGDRRLGSDSGDGGTYSALGNNPDFTKFLMDGDTNTSGTVLMACLSGLVLLSIFRILRHFLFNLWLLSHIGLAIGVIIFCVAHGVGSISIAIVWWIVDWVIRYVVMAGCRYPTKAEITKLRPDIVQLSFAKPATFTYRPGQFVQIAVPSISVLQFHPISISSAPHEENVTLHIRALGDWSRKLLALAEKRTAGSEVSILLEGPYGNVAVDMDNEYRYKTALLVSGGIGVTHCQSVGKALLFDHLEGGRALSKLRFVWAVREVDMVRDMPPLGGAVSRLRNSTNENGGDIELATVVGAQSVSSCSYLTSSEVTGAELEHAPTVVNADCSNASVVQTDIYLTKGTEGEQSDLDWNVHSGRPNLDKLFEEMRQEALANGETCVAVFGCGPGPLMNQLQNACRHYSAGAQDCGRGVSFDLHLETFEF